MENSVKIDEFIRQYIEYLKNTRKIIDAKTKNWEELYDKCTLDFYSYLHLNFEDNEDFNRANEWLYMGEQDVISSFMSKIFTINVADFENELMNILNANGVRYNIPTDNDIDAMGDDYYNLIVYEDGERNFISCGTLDWDSKNNVHTIDISYLFADVVFKNTIVSKTLLSVPGFEDMLINLIKNKYNVSVDNDIKLINKLRQNIEKRKTNGVIDEEWYRMQEERLDRRLQAVEELKDTIH